MKKSTLFVLMFACASVLISQNLQLHYDFRHSLDKNNPIERNYLNATFEFFKPDKWGNTFMFIDADFKGEKGNISGIYGEIAREFKIKDFPLLPHIEFNGGVGFDYVISNAYLIGVAYPFRLKNFFFNSYATYKYNNFKTASHDVQITATWNGKILNEKISICGFIDLWTENKTDASGKKLILYAEPQFWYNIWKTFSVGTEIRISQNFEYFTSAFKVYPTLGVKYTFL